MKTEYIICNINYTKSTNIGWFYVVLLC